MEWAKNDPERAWQYKDAVIAKTPILELAREAGLSLENRETGSFTHLSYCPFHEGKSGGRERTPSFYLSEKTNSFCCFGCARAGNPIDFVSLINGMPFLEALKKLAIRAKLLSPEGDWDELELENVQQLVPVHDPTKTVGYYLFKISAVLRGYIHSFLNSPDLDKELRWMEKVAAKADHFLYNADYDDWEFARDVAASVERAVDKRKGK